jgi:hypothetical protein
MTYMSPCRATRNSLAPRTQHASSIPILGPYFTNENYYAIALRLKGLAFQLLEFSSVFGPHIGSHGGSTSRILVQ